MTAEKFLTQISKIGSCLKVESNEIIYRQGDSNSLLYFLKKGTVVIYDKHSVQREIIWVAKEGEWIGLQSFFSGKNFKHEAQACADSQLITLPTELFEKLLKSDSELSTQIMNQLCERIEFNEKRAAYWANVGMKKRILGMLRFLSQRDFKLFYSNHLSSQIFPLDTLATFFDITTRKLKNEISKLESAGLLKIHEGQIFVH